MDLQKKFTFRRVRKTIRDLLSLLRFRRDLLKREFERDTENKNLLENLDAADKLNKDWNDWMTSRYHGKWEKVRAKKEFHEVLEFLSIYFEDVKIAKLLKIESNPDQAVNLGQQAKGLSCAIEEFSFLEKITERPKHIVTNADIH